MNKKPYGGLRYPYLGGITTTFRTPSGVLSICTAPCFDGTWIFTLVPNVNLDTDVDLVIRRGEIKMISRKGDRKSDMERSPLLRIFLRRRGGSSL